MKMFFRQELIRSYINLVLATTALLLLVSIIIPQRSGCCDAFLLVTPSIHCGSRIHPKTFVVAESTMYAKKKGTKSASASSKGFGKLEPAITPSSSTSQTSSTTTSAPAGGGDYLQSIAEDKNTISRSSSSSSSDNTAEEDNDNKTPQERAADLLRNKYGLQTLAEQQQTAKQFEQRKLEQKQVQAWKRKVEQKKDDESFDLFAVLPGPVIIAIDRFLKTGLAVTTGLFILGGFAIVLEAWSKTSGQALPDDIQNAIVNIVEPNFTPGLIVLLSFSVSLGIFAALQLGSEGATYREKD
jgi:hypothetical protein